MSSSLRRLAPAVAATAMFSLLTACSTATPPRGFSGHAEDRTAEALAPVNTLRAARGLPPLSMAAPAQEAALVQAKRMAASREMKHMLGFGDSFGQRMLASNVRLPAAENIAAGQQTTDAVMKAWIASPKHLENMLGPAYRSVGVAVARQGAENGHPYWAMVLSR